MTAKNFSPGDVVVCVENEGVPELVVRGIYTVVDAYDDNEGRPGVELAEVKPVGCDEGGEPYVGYGSESFRLAYTPDPKVEREHTEVPIKRPVSA